MIFDKLRDACGNIARICQR